MPTSDSTSILDKLGLPAPQGWPIERVIPLMAGSVIVGTLALARLRNPKWRLMTGVVGANLMLQGTVGWCPASGALYKLGMPRARDRAGD
jgi:hypothetical protein